MPTILAILVNLQGLFGLEHLIKYQMLKPFRAVPNRSAGLIFELARWKFGEEKSAILMSDRIRVDDQLGMLHVGGMGEMEAEAVALTAELCQL